MKRSYREFSGNSKKLTAVGSSDLVSAAEAMDERENEPMVSA